MIENASMRSFNNALVRSFNNVSVRSFNNASVRLFIFPFLAVDTPDPYVVLMVQGAPNCYQRTNAFDNNTDPEWNETFKFYLNPKIPSEIGMYGHLDRVFLVYEIHIRFFFSHRLIQFFTYM